MCSSQTYISPFCRILYLSPQSWRQCMWSYHRFNCVLQVVYATKTLHIQCKKINVSLYNTCEYLLIIIIYLIYLFTWCHLCVTKFWYKILMEHHDHISNQSTSYEILNRCVMFVEFIQIYLHFFCHTGSVWTDLGFWISCFFRYKLK